jgi:hypothetical protein
MKYIKLFENFNEPEMTRTPIKPITIGGKTYDIAEDLPTRELGIGSYSIKGDIVMVGGDTPLQDWIDLDHMEGTDGIYDGAFPPGEGESNGDKDSGDEYEGPKGDKDSGDEYEGPKGDEGTGDE